MNTTRVNAADITSRVDALVKTDKDRNNHNRGGFFEEFEVSAAVPF